MAPPHSLHAYGADATGRLSMSTRQYSSVRFLDIKAAATTYAPTFKKYLYSFPLPQPTLGIIGFKGHVSITSGTPRFSEALISAHYSPSCHSPTTAASYDTYDQIGHAFP